MSFKMLIARSELLPALAAVAPATGAVNNRDLLPILSHVLLTTDGDRLRLTASDLEVEVRASAALLAPGQGAATVPAKMLLDICRGLPEGSDLEFSEAKRGTVMLRSGKSRYTLATFPADGFPLFEHADADRSLSIELPELLRGIERCRFAMGLADVRYYLNGLFFEPSERTLRLVATDGHRLASADCQLLVPAEAAKTAIVPRKAIGEIQRLLAGQKGPLTLSFADTQVAIEHEGVRLVSKLIDGKFPSYERVIPPVDKVPIVVERRPLVEALKRLKLLDFQVDLRFTPGGLALESANTRDDAGEEFLSAVFEGNPIEVIFNIGYMLDALNAIPCDEVAFHNRKANLKSLLMEGVASDAQKGRFVIMAIERTKS